MQSSPDSSQQPADWIFRNGPGILLLITRAWATSLEVFLRRGFGGKYLNSQGALVFLLVPFYCLAWEGYDVRAMFLFLVIYLFMCITHRIGSFVARCRGHYEHSFYDGVPRLQWIFRRCSEVTIKRFIEPVFAIGLGTVLADYHAPLGMYVVAGGFALMLTAHEAALQGRWRAEEMNDAVIEQQFQAERFRRMRREF